MTTLHGNIETASNSRVTEDIHKGLFLKSRGFYISAAILIASLIYYLSFASYGFSEGDWGGIVVAAERFLQGDVFYRDFTTVYTPGLYLYTALAFKLFGVSLLSATVAWSIIRALNCLLIYLLGTKFLSRKVALLLPLILWFASGPVHKSFLVFFELLHLLFLVRLLSTDNKGFYFLSGIMAGISLVFRIDLFVFYVIMTLLVEVFKIIERYNQKTGILPIALHFKKIAFFSFGASLLIVPFTLYLFFNSAIVDAIDLTWNFITASKIRMFHLASIKEIFSWGRWDFINYAVLIIPFTIYFLFLTMLLGDIKNRKFNKEDKKLLILFFYGLLFSHQIIRTPWLGSLYQTFPPILILDMYLISRYYVKLRSRHLKKLHLIYPAALVTVNSALLFLIIASCTMGDIYTNHSIFIRFTNTKLLSVPKVETYTTHKLADDFERVRNIIENETEYDDYIFIVHHLPMYYFVTGRKNATRYDFMETYIGSDKKQLEVVRNLADKKVKLIIFEADYPRTPYAPIVINYINEHYRIKEIIGNKIIYIKKQETNVTSPD